MSEIELVAKLKAVDEASGKIKEIGEKTEKAMKQVKDSTEKADFSFKKFTTSVSGLMTAGFSLYNAYDRIEDAQLAVQKAQNALTQAQINAKNAQDAYNKAVEKYGADSDQAKDALEKLQLAQDKVVTAQEILKDRQDKVNEAMIQMAIQTIPTTITAITNLKGVISELTIALDGAKFSTIALSSALGALTGALGAAIAALVVYEMETSGAGEKMREVSGLMGKGAGLATKMAQANRELTKSVTDDLSQITESFKNAYDDVVGHSTWTDMWDEITEATKEGLSANIDEIDRAMGDIQTTFRRPFSMEVVLTINTQSMATQIRKIIEQTLKSVLIEKTSSQAATLRIRVPATIQPRAGRSRPRVY